MALFKRSIGLILTVCMLISTVLPVCADNTYFKDVPNGSPYEESIRKMAEAGIIKGIGNDEFGYENPCTRAQFITFLYRAAGSPDVGNPAVFADVAANAYYSDAISWACNNGIAKGFEDNTFRPEMTVDRSHAATFLYEWAKVTGYGDIAKSCYLSEYADVTEVEVYAVTAYAWAVASGIVDISADKKLNPKAEVTRGWVANAIAKLWGTHYHKWGEYTSNNDGTHSRVCELDASHTEKEDHTFNAGELTKKATASADGEIVYTCTKCKAVKIEAVPAGKEVITRADLEEAIAATSWAYYAKGPKLQYDSREFSSKLSTYRGGLGRLTAESAPELSTKDTTFYSVCSDFVHQAYWEALDIKMLGEIYHPFGFSTMYIFNYADNQLNTSRNIARYNDPLTEDDVDACVMKYINFDLYKQNYLSRLNTFARSDVFESEGFTDYTTGIQFKSDGNDGDIHYSYYDTEGNKLSYREVQEKHVIPFVADYEKNLRVGDVFMYVGHALMYAGNNLFIHCNGQKVSRDTPAADIIETNGAIFADFDEMTSWISGEHLDLFVITRPLEFVTTPGFDEDPGNDVVADTIIPENTKSRIKYPLMDVDRTVDINDFGTAVSGGELTYTVEIFNKTDDEKYLEWLSRDNKGKTKETYKNIKVTEIIPEGTQLVADSIVGGGKMENGTITWNISEIKPGESVALSYKVKVTAPIGSQIVSQGGMVDNIPSNRIINTVGADKLDNAELTALENISAGGDDALAKYGEDSAFANAIYKEIGEELTLPKIEDVVNNLFTIESHIPGAAEEVGRWVVSINDPVDMFVRQTEVSEEFSSIKSMIIDRYWGGERFYVGDEIKWEYATNGIREFRADYLEAGDVIVYVDVEDSSNATLKYEPAEVVVMVYDGSKLISVTKTKDATSYKIYEEDEVEAKLLSAIETKYDLFFALRPSQISK